MSKIRSRLNAIIIAVLTVALIFSGICLYRQQKETEKYYSVIKGVASCQYSEYQWSLDYLDMNLQKEVKSRRMQIGEGSSDEINENKNYLTYLTGMAQQMNSVYYGLQLNKRPRTNDQIYDLANSFGYFSGFLSSIKIPKGQIVTSGKNSYLVLKGEAYDGIVIISKIVKKLNQIKNHALKFRIRSINSGDEEWNFWKEVQSKNEEYIHSNEFDNEIRNLETLKSFL